MMTREAFTPYPMLLDPHLASRPWGGARLRTNLRKTALPDEKIGESWELSDHPDGLSRVANGPYAGRAFGNLVKEHPLGTCGVSTAPERFPLLIKYIDAAQDLSIQVHPGDEQAKLHDDRGKTECWYIMECSEGAEVICGLKPGATAESLRIGATSGHLIEQVQRLPIKAGSFVYVPAGTVHAILAGTLLCEIQQSSNLTFRLWDWNRLPSRELHWEEGLRAVQFGPDPAEELGSPFALEPRNQSGEIELVGNRYFSVSLLSLEAGQGSQPWNFPNPHGRIVNVVQGGGGWDCSEIASDLGKGEFRLGQTWFFPAGIEAVRVNSNRAGLRLLLSRSHELG